jgi:hypothetical protein
VAQVGEQLCLTLEARLVVGAGGAQDLHRHPFAGQPVARAPDGAHAAGLRELLQLETASDPLSALHHRRTESRLSAT